MKFSLEKVFQETESQCESWVACRVSVGIVLCSGVDGLLSELSRDGTGAVQPEVPISRRCLTRLDSGVEEKLLF